MGARKPPGTPEPVVQHSEPYIRSEMAELVELSRRMKELGATSFCYDGFSAHFGPVAVPLTKLPREPVPQPSPARAAEIAEEAERQRREKELRSV